MGSERGKSMITAKRAIKITTETDDNKRNELIDKLSEEDAKMLLKRCLKAVMDNSKPDFEIN
ncbi:lipoprotein [Ruminiclostridium papyrosolvens DSM 2782]|uniref:Lipoprotein n=2 Tax=Ruminiclostridium papyrosolvens TaxID=29362 RepID=F1TEF1_9FIRM|nr:lipoprotein [Ruminiclostridium papyrosolvens DSM 2782]